MIIAIPRETTIGENRVAVTPEQVKKYSEWGFQVKIETSAGTASGFDDDDYLKAGAEIAPDAAQTYQHADIILKIWAPLPDEDRLLKPGQTIIANFQALAHPARVAELAKQGLTCFALDMLPRISRAQSMDILSSQSNLAGYKAVINAVNLLPRAIPLMMTAAGTVSPAKVLVLGAGVAGLQAIATAKRLGAQVFASDVRPQVKEQVESLGARFLEVKTSETFETSGGYAQETSPEYRRQQQLAVAEQLAKTDIAVTTALIPGKKAPVLITRGMIEHMPRGSVIIDMAAANGGNVEGSIDNQTVNVNGVTIVGNSNLASELPVSASRLFAQNIYNFLAPMYQKETKQIVFNYDDELISKTCVAKSGELLM